MYKLANGKWRAAVTLGYDGNKRVVKTKSGFRTKKEALEYLPTLRNEPENKPDIKFYELYDEWSENHFKRISKSQENVYRAAYKHCSSIKYRVFNTLRTAELQKAVDDCELSRRTKETIKALLVVLYKHALENDYCDRNYATFVKLPPKEKGTRDAFTAEEIEKFWKDYGPGREFAGYILIMIYTGMRYGEISTIGKENIYLSEKYMVGGIKSDAGKNRVIPLCDKILPVVTQFYNQSNKKLLDTPRPAFYNDYYSTLKRLKIRRLTPHCCRHTFATLMARAGVQPGIITEVAGHENYSTTLGYTHIQLADKLKAVNSI